MAFISKRGIVRIFRTLRRERRLNSRIIDNFIMAVIVVNAISLGMETSHYFNAEYGTLLRLIDNVALAIFTLEIGMKMLLTRSRFFRNAWNIFDFLIVGLSLLTFIPQLSVLRSLRILRIFLLISFMPRLRFIVQSLLLSLPGIFGISILLAVMFYVFGVIATQIFGADNPYTFGSLGRSFYSLFRIMTLDGCWTIINKVLKNHQYAYFFFIPFILLSSYIILNIFIAIIVNSMREARLRNEEKAREERQRNKEKVRQAEIEADDRRSELVLDTLMKKLNEIDERIARMEAANRSGKEETAGAKRVSG